MKKHHFTNRKMNGFVILNLKYILQQSRKNEQG